MDEIQLADWVDRVAQVAPQAVVAWLGECEVEAIFGYPPGYATAREFELANAELARRGLRIQLREEAFPGIEIVTEP